MPNFSKVAFEEAKRIYKEELSENGSFYQNVNNQEVFKEGSTKVSNKLQLIDNWYRTVAQNIPNELAKLKGKSEDDPDKQLLYGKIFAYRAIVENTYREYANGIFGSTEQDKIDFAQDAYRNNLLLDDKIGTANFFLDSSFYTFQMFNRISEEIQNKFVSFDAEGEYTLEVSNEAKTEDEKLEIENLDDEKIQEEYDKMSREESDFDEKILGINSIKNTLATKEKARTEMEQRISNYKGEIETKFEFVKNYYNSVMKKDVIIEGNTFKDAAENSKDLFKGANVKKLSLLDKVKHFQDSIQDTIANGIELNRNGAKTNIKQQLVTKASNPSVEPDEIENAIRDQKTVLDQYNKDLDYSYSQVAKEKVSLYIATKRAMDGRWFISKLFHPTRTKNENKMFDDMKKDLKDSLQVDDDFLAKLDQVAKNPKEPVEFTNRGMKVVEDSATFKDEKDAAVNAFELKEEMSLTSKQNELNTQISEFAKATTANKDKTMEH